MAASNVSRIATAESKSKPGRKAGTHAGGDFLKVARELRHLQETDPSAFFARVRELGFNRRKAYYLVQIDREFSHLGADPKLLKKVGWTKLGILASHVTRDNWKDLITRSLSLNVPELQALLNEAVGAPKSHHLTLRMTDEQKAVFDEALRTFAPPRSAKATIDKAAVLADALKAALTAKASS